MSTMTKSKTTTRTVTGTNVLEVAESIRQEIISLYDFYGRHFPYDMAKLRNDIGQILLWDMCDSLKVQFYDGEKIERLSYEFIPRADPEAVHTPPGEFPRFAIPEGLNVRVVAHYSTRKPEHEVREFYDALGWRPSEPLTRTGQGTTERYGAFRSGDYGVTREVYTDLPHNTQRVRKETAL